MRQNGRHFFGKRWIIKLNLQVKTISFLTTLRHYFASNNLPGLASTVITPPIACRTGTEREYNPVAAKPSFLRSRVRLRAARVLM